MCAVSARATTADDPGIEAMDDQTLDEATLRCAMQPARLSILVACSAAPKKASELGLSPRAANWHLKVLETAGLIAREGEAWAALGDWRLFIAAVEALEERPSVLSSDDSS